MKENFAADVASLVVMGAAMIFIIGIIYSIVTFTMNAGNNFESRTKEEEKSTREFINNCTKQKDRKVELLNMGTVGYLVCNPK